MTENKTSVSPMESIPQIHEKPTTHRAMILSTLFFLYVTCLFGATAILQDGLFERDGYYHARFAQLMPERGVEQTFPWTQLSIWREQFSDKEFLYHLAMMPFAQIGSDPIFGVRLFALLLSVSVLVALFLMLRSHNCRWPLFFAAMPLAAGGLFIARLGMIRSHVLSMALIILGIHFLLKGKWRAVFVLGFVYAWSYTMPFVLLMTAIPFVIGKWTGRGGLDWKLPMAAGAGSALGLAVHPYSPLMIKTFFTYLQIFQIGMQGTGKSGFELGNEIYPYALTVFFNIYPLVVILVPALVIFVILHRKKLSAETLGIVLSALCWFGMTAASPRFVEYSVLFLAAAYAFTLRDWISADHPSIHSFLNRNYLRRALAVIAITALVGFHIRSMDFYIYYQSKAAPPRYFKNASVWMAQHLEPGETVINLFWDDFPDLFYDGSRQRYIWGIDPTYSIRENSEKAALLERFRRHEIYLDGSLLSRSFQSRYLILRTKREGGFPELGFPPFHKVYGDSSAVIYLIK